MTDTERLDKLQELLGSYSDKVICRKSYKGHGWRLHETNREGAVSTVREAIDNFLMDNLLDKFEDEIVKERAGARKHPECLTCKGTGRVSKELNPTGVFCLDCEGTGILDGVPF